MPSLAITQDERKLTTGQQHKPVDAMLPLTITKTASKQTFYTVWFLVDHDRRLDAYRAYAYFRWLDDQLDQGSIDHNERLALIERQQTLITQLFAGRSLLNMTPEEHMILDLISSDRTHDSGLQSYIGNMLAVMVFDADRRGRWISEQELGLYTKHLAEAVTEALHYFIGHGHNSPLNSARYLSAAAAHITHMLRDTYEDVALGYYNIPHEYLDAAGIDPWDIASEPYRAWVKQRVQLARAYFKAGSVYLAQIPSLRCRIAGAAYMARFTGVLDAIERDEYLLRPAYAASQNFGAVVRQSWSACTDILPIKRAGLRAKSAVTQQHTSVAPH